MLLNRIWVALIAIAMVMACGKAFIFHDFDIFKHLVENLFESVKMVLKWLFTSLVLFAYGWG